MAYFATNYTEENFLNVLKGTTFSAPTSLYIGLYTANPTDAGIQTNEIYYTGYTRKQITFDAPVLSTFNGVSQWCIKNSAEITFPTTPANMTAITATYVGISDSSTRQGGHMLLYGSLERNLTIVGDEAPVFVKGEVIFYTSGNLSDVYKKKYLNAFRGTSITGFTPYMALWHGNPETNGSKELGGSGTNYARVPFSFSAISPNGDKSQMQNASEFAFARASTDWAQQDLTHRVIYDAKTGGNPVWIQSGNSKTISRGRKVIFRAGDVKVTID